jgi:prophage regulatory protein
VYTHIFPVLRQQRIATSASSATPAFYRLRDVMRITALSRSTIYRRITEGRFPAPVHLGGRASGWSRTSLQQWIDNPDEYRTSEHSN